MSWFKKLLLIINKFCQFGLFLCCLLHIWHFVFCSTFCSFCIFIYFQSNWLVANLVDFNDYKFVFKLYLSIVFLTLRLFPKCPNPDHLDFPNTIIPNSCEAVLCKSCTIPSVRDPGYTSREWGPSGEWCPGNWRVEIDVGWDKCIREKDMEPFLK